jgi:hypothetical protein
MRLFKWFKRAKEPEVKYERTIATATRFALSVLHCDDYTKFMTSLRKEMDEMSNLLPDIPHETAAQRILRQDSLIALAVNNIHENPNLGMGAIVDDEEPAQSFMLVTLELREMNKTNHAVRWAQAAIKSMRERTKNQSGHEA